MASSSGISSGSSSQFQNEEDLRQIMDIRKRKRMISNRESARRSRMKKQKHMDDMIAQVNEIRNENNQILMNLNVTTQLYLNVEAENSVLRAQIDELTHRLQSLNDIITCLNASNLLETDQDEVEIIAGGGHDDFLMNPWNLLCFNQPIMPSPDVHFY